MEDNAHQLVLTPLAHRVWRLCGRGVVSEEGAGVIAYVELLDSGAYEAVWVSVGLGSARFSTLEDLFQAATQMIEHSRSLGAMKPEPIPHRPPAHA